MVVSGFVSRISGTGGGEGVSRAVLFAGALLVLLASEGLENFCAPQRLLGGVAGAGGGWLMLGGGEMVVAGGSLFLGCRGGGLGGGGREEDK